MKSYACTVVSGVIVVLSSLLIGGCSSPGSSESEEVRPSVLPEGVEVERLTSDTDAWQVGVSNPSGDFDSCVEDTAISEGLMSADMPASRYTWILKAGSKQVDADRIAGCLMGELSSGTVATYEPAS